MLSMELEMCDIWSSSVYIEESPPVCESCQYWSGVLIQPMSEVVAQNIGDEGYAYGGQPVSGKDFYQRF
jgi:hypothetical protein